MIHGYPSIYALGHRAVASLTDGPVIVEEKIDGSQFSFGLFDGELQARSKGSPIHVDAPEPMFKRAIETVRALAPELHPDWTYRGEYLGKPKHNALAYDRIPARHVILFDINTGLESYLTPEAKRAEAERLGLECVPVLFVGKIDGLEHFRSFLATPSVLGGQKIEGVVIKPLAYDQFGLDRKCLLAKFVSEAFKETHAREWVKSNPTAGDIVSQIAATYTTQARWMKAVQHLRERGVIEDSPRDIGKLIAEIPEDVLKECGAEIKELLFKWAWPHIRRSITRGMPEWYKEELVKQQFAESPSAEEPRP